MAATDFTIPFSRKSLKRLESIAARIAAVSEMMKVADKPTRNMQAFRLLENLSLETHQFYRELLNEFRHARTND
jgi:hypothetical protein